MSIPVLDKVIHQPIRTRIMALLVDRLECDYPTVKKTLDVTDGHMSTHMRELVKNGYVSISKAFVNNKPRTTYKITQLGRKRFAEYVRTLKEIIDS